VHEDSFKAALGILAAKGGSYWFDRDALKSDLRILKDRFFISAGDALDKLKGTIRDAIPDPRLRKNGERDEESSLKMPDVPGGEPKTSPFGRDAIGNADSRRKVSFAGAGEPVASNDRHENPQKQPRAKAAFDEFPRLAPVPKPLEIPHDASPTRREEDMASLRQLDDSMMTGPVKFVDPMLYEWRSRNDGPVAVVAEEERDQLEAEAKGLIAANDYYDDLHKQRRVAAIFKQLYPGQLRTAPLDFGEGV
jgi:hypothetical protein